MGLIEWDLVHGDTEDKREDVEESELESDEGKQLGNDVGEDDEQLGEEGKDPEDEDDVEVETQQSYPVELSKLAVEAGLYISKYLTVAERGDRWMVSW